MRWTVRVDSAREHAEVYANANGVILGMNVGETRRAQSFYWAALAITVVALVCLVGIYGVRNRKA